MHASCQARGVAGRVSNPSISHSCRASISKQKLHTNTQLGTHGWFWASGAMAHKLVMLQRAKCGCSCPQPTFRLRHSRIFRRTACAAVTACGCVMGQCQGRLVKSRRVQLIPRTQQMTNNLQRQGRSTRPVERRSYCTDELLAGWKFADAHSSRSGRRATACGVRLLLPSAYVAAPAQHYIPPHGMCPCHSVRGEVCCLRC